MHSLPTFPLFAQTPPILCPDPTILCPAFYVRTASGSSVDLSGSLNTMVQMEGDRRFTIAVTLLPRKTQPMADNYRGRQSRTGGVTIYCTRPFQVADTRTARGQHGLAARQSRVRILVTDMTPGRCLHVIFNFVSRSTLRGLHSAFPLQVYTARARCRREPSMQTLTTRRTAIHNFKQGTRANVLIRLTLTVRQTRLCNNHRRRRNAPHPSNENGLR